MVWVAVIFGIGGVLCEWVIRRQDANQSDSSRVNRRTLERINRTHPHGE